MKHRKLRIVWSVGCGLAAVLLIALAIHTSRYQVTAGRYISKSHFARFVAYQQWISMCLTQISVKWPPFIFNNYIDNPTPDLAPVRTWFLGRGVEPGAIAELRCSLWALIALSATTGALPWIHYYRRFSLRTLLITMTLVAVGLGLIVWLR
jgi:hypothetical protein